MKTRTFTIIKPSAVAAGNAGKILDAIISHGFTIRALKMVFLSRNDAAKLYAVHKNRPFYSRLITYMSSGAVVVAILEKEDAIASFRELVGNTDPSVAEPNTIRHLFGNDITRNAIHAADCEENASKEASYFFKEREIIEAGYCL